MIRVQTSIRMVRLQDYERIRDYRVIAFAGSTVNEIIQCFETKYNNLKVYNYKNNLLKKIELSNNSRNTT